MVKDAVKLVKEEIVQSNAKKSLNAMTGSLIANIWLINKTGQRSVNLMNLVKAAVKHAKNLRNQIKVTSKLTQNASISILTVLNGIKCIALLDVKRSRLSQVKHFMMLAANLAVLKFKNPTQLPRLQNTKR